MSSMRVADRYALDREIGRGGSGAVWLARDEVLGRAVAIKRIGLPPGASTYDVSRAEREARISAQVNHANVVSVFDFVNDGEHTWLVTEYVEGTTLAQLIRDRGRLTPAEAAPMLLQVADALAAAHGMAIVHRDVKPSNILIALDGTAKLSDFGIARAVADASLTQTGLVTGSPAYIAPEVATGAAATTASDVWSFGATIYHALSGHPPYEATSGENAVLGVLYRVAHEPPPRLRGGGWLAPLLEATMDHDPDNRLTMDDVAAYLHAGPQGTADSAPAGPGTQVLPLVAAAPDPPDAPTDDNPTSTAVAAAASSSTSTRTHPWKLWLAIGGAAAVLVLAAIGAMLLLGGGDDDPQDDAAGLPNTTTDASSDNEAATEPGDETTDSSPSADDLESFASSYVSTAADDPDAGFALLTPDYQARSPEYAEFWGSVNNPEILEVSADPDDLTVTYTYKYDFPGSGNLTERVTLFLVQDGDQLLIDNAVSG
ncbi:serine/threonine-protein kinase [Nocardioides sp. HM23]|uniref:serine/threonine-protein kinase n=1 Tax=Nocardioides bizhenqiangii TaxID=3095076 RepID=UPI002ACA1A10|nr:serine/threonine-protein kinase [Nocardioides sp. HM23]MDZ5623317.1 serine/threonine-protein kinase [Nocardioides sp. HM23]